jgi:hypothetical protein
MLRISEQTLDTEEEVCVCFIDWQKAFDHANWTKLMNILNRTGTNWQRSRFITKLHMDQGVKLKPHRGNKKSEDWKRSYKKILLVADSIQVAQQIPYILKSNPHPNLIRTQFLAIS